MPVALGSRLLPHRFENLPSLTHKQVVLWNWYARVGPSGIEWTAWVSEVFGHLLQRPAGQQLRLIQTHLVDAQFGDKVLSFGTKQELFIGRDPENDVVLAANAIANRHARLTLNDGKVHLEDLGGKLGTYLEDKKLPPHQSQPVRNGDQFTVFPYKFRLLLEQCWSPETDVRLSDCSVQPLSRAEFFRTCPAGWRVFVVNAHPRGDRALLGVSPVFLGQMQKRILAPLGLDKVKVSVPSDDALLGFIILALLEHLNRKLKFPLQFSMGKGTRNELADTTRGMLLSFAIGFSGLTGTFQIFLPLEFLTKSEPQTPSDVAENYPAGLSWTFPVSAGFVDLLPEEIAQVGLGDILVAQSSSAILFPRDFTKGWALTAEESNFGQARIDKYFERSVPVETGGETTPEASKPDIQSLSLRLHVVLGEKEFTLAEIQSLSPGTIVELDIPKSEPVRLMVNGKILGEGELVDVEGKLAVKVLRWRSGA